MQKGSPKAAFFCASVIVEALLPAIDHFENLPVTNRYWYRGNGVVLNEVIGNFIVGYKTLRLVGCILHRIHGFAGKATFSDQFMVRYFGKQPCSNFFGKLVEHVGTSASGVVNPVGNNTSKLHLIAYAFLLNSHTKAVRRKDAVEIVGSNNDGVIGIVERGTEASTDNVAKHIKKDDIIFFVKAEFLKQGD